MTDIKIFKDNDRIVITVNGLDMNTVRDIVGRIAAASVSVIDAVDAKPDMNANDLESEKIPENDKKVVEISNGKTKAEAVATEEPIQENPVSVEEPAVLSEPTVEEPVNEAAEISESIPGSSTTVQEPVEEVIQESEPKTSVETQKPIKENSAPQTELAEEKPIKAEKLKDPVFVVTDETDQLGMTYNGKTPAEILNGQAPTKAYKWLINKLKNNELDYDDRIKFQSYLDLIEFLKKQFAGDPAELMKSLSDYKINIFLQTHAYALYPTERDKVAVKAGFKNFDDIFDEAGNLKNIPDATKRNMVGNLIYYIHKN